MSSRTRASMGMLTFALVFMLVAASCTGGSNKAPSPTSSPAGGGVLRAGVSAFSLSDVLDPTGEYTGYGWMILNALVRTLVVYKYAEGADGLAIVPDLATTVPEPSADGLTYQFKLKPGIAFGPPLSRPITSKDIEYAFERINTASLAAQYGFYYNGVIEGMTGTAKKPEPISGIETPDPQTIIFHLTQPTGDFLARLTMWATAPIPPEVGGCFLDAGTYGRYVISSGPYMIQGSAELDASSCDTMKPISGFDPESSLALVRNPAYDPSTDQESGRRNYPDGIKVTVDTNVGDIYQKIERGELDVDYYDPPPSTVVQHYLTTSSLSDRLKTPQGPGQIQYLSMNFTVPPFDDIHVRRAVNYVIDKAAVLRAWGGSNSAEIATHLIPPYVLGDVPEATFDVYPTADNGGDLSKAQAEMKLSRYDSNGDGKCDSPVCGGLMLVTLNTPPLTQVEPIVVSNLAEIGIEVVPREMDFGAAFAEIWKPKNMVPLTMAIDWGYDYPDGFPYDKSLFYSTSIVPVGNMNFSMLGLTPAAASDLGIPYPQEPIPSVDKQIDECQALGVGVERNACWANLDKYMMQQIAPYTPLLWRNRITTISSSVTSFQYTPQQQMAFVNIAVNNGLQPGA